VNRSRLITILGSLILVCLAAAAWLLVLAPRVDQPAEIQSQSESIRDQASNLERQIIQLEALSEELPARVARFEDLKDNFPRTADVPDLLDQIRDAADESGVSVQALETSAPVLVVPATEAEGAATGTEGAAATPAPAPPVDAAAVPGSADPAAGVGVPVAGAGEGTLATMPMSVTVSGSYDDLSVFLLRAERLPRAWLIDTLQATAAQEAGQEITLTASGSMFVLDTTGIAVPSGVSPDSDQ
jgi:Tfp pilus assembly protein PilO